MRSQMKLTDNKPRAIQLKHEDILLFRRVNRWVPVEDVVDTQQGAKGRLEGVHQQQQLEGARRPPAAAQPPSGVQSHRQLEGDLDDGDHVHPVRLRLGLDQRVIVRRDVEVLDLLQEVQRAARRLVQLRWVELHRVDDWACGLAMGAKRHVVRLRERDAR